MAKKQSFADKVTKQRQKGQALKMVVKVVEAKKSEKGNWKFPERFVKVDDLDELEKVLSAQ